MLDLIILLIGISGVGVIGMNFILEVTNRISKDHHIFAFLNIYGSLTLLIYSLYNKVWLFVTLNSFLVITGLYGLYLLYRKK